MEEIWKPIKGYEGLYEVSNLGKIKTLSRIINGRKMPEKIKQLDESYNIINIFDSVNEASQKTNIIRTEISNCLNKRQKTAGGYHWQYYEINKEEEKKDEE